MRPLSYCCRRCDIWRCLIVVGQKMPHSGPMWRWLLTFRLWNGVTRARGAHNLEGPSKLWKKRSEDWEETQTLRAGRSKAEPKIFATPQTPFPGARDGQNLISWRWSLLLPTTPVWWGSMHAISSHRGNRPTNPQTHRTDYNTLRRSFASTQCNEVRAVIVNL